MVRGACVAEGACIAGGTCHSGVCVAGKMTIAAGSKHPTAMHSYYFPVRPIYTVIIKSRGTAL